MMLQLSGVVEMESLDDGGEALIVSVSDESGTADSGLWCRIISNLGDSQYNFLSRDGAVSVGVEGHPQLAGWIGKRVQIVVSEHP